MGALEHQDYPFALLVERLQPERDPSRSPIFQVSFLLHNFIQTQETEKVFLGNTTSWVNWSGIKVKPFVFDQYESQYDLSLELTEANLTLTGAIKYNTDLFDEQTITRLTGHFQTLLAGIVAHPECIHWQNYLCSHR